jgi:Na+/melibiose symporter-like transporter
LGYDALQTGLKLVPLSIGLVLFSVVGSKLSAVRSARNIARWGQVSLSVGLLLVLAAIQPELNGFFFWLGMLIDGAGFGLLASQLGNVSMSSVGKSDTAVVGGLQGTFQNLGTSFGTAIVGSAFMLLLAAGFTSSVQSSTALSAEAKSTVLAQSETGVQVVSKDQAEQYVLDSGGSQTTAESLAATYQNAQLDALREAMFIVFAVSVLSLLLSRNLPAKVS